MRARWREACRPSALALAVWMADGSEPAISAPPAEGRPIPRRRVRGVSCGQIDPTTPREAGHPTVMGVVTDWSRLNSPAVVAVCVGPW